MVAVRYCRKDAKVVLVSLLNSCSTFKCKSFMVVSIFERVHSFKDHMATFLLQPHNLEYLTSLN